MLGAYTYRIFRFSLRYSFHFVRIYVLYLMMLNTIATLGYYLRFQICRKVKIYGKQ